MHGERQQAVDRAELYLRSLLPGGYSQQQAATLERVAELVEEGVIGERQVQVCGHQIPASAADTRTAVGERLVTRLAAFQEWAKRNDCSLAPALELRVVEDSLADASYRVVRLPAILLAEYRGGDLRCVTPHRDADTVRTVDDRLGELAAGEPTAFEPVAYAALPAPDRERTDESVDSDEAPPLLRR